MHLPILRLGLLVLSLYAPTCWTLIQILGSEVSGNNENALNILAPNGKSKWNADNEHQVIWSKGSNIIDVSIYLVAITTKSALRVGPRQVKISNFASGTSINFSPISHIRPYLLSDHENVSDFQWFLKVVDNDLNFSAISSEFIIYDGTSSNRSPDKVWMYVRRYVIVVIITALLVILLTYQNSILNKFSKFTKKIESPSSKKHIDTSKVTSNASSIPDHSNDHEEPVQQVNVNIESKVDLQPKQMHLFLRNIDDNRFFESRRITAPATAHNNQVKFFDRDDPEFPEHQRKFSL